MSSSHDGSPPLYWGLKALAVLTAVTLGLPLLFDGI